MFGNMTLAIIKPDGMKHSDAIIQRIEDEGWEIISGYECDFTEIAVAKFYAEHVGKPFFQGLSDHMTSGPVMILLLMGIDVIKGWRTAIGATDPTKAKPGTIRGKFGTQVPANVVHGSDSPESAEREIEFFFQIGR